MIIKQAVGCVAAFLILASPVAAQERRDVVSDALTVGQAAFAKGDYIVAVAIYNRLLRDNSVLPEALLNRGRAYAALKQFPDAERDFSAYCRLMPDVMVGYLERGRVRRASGRAKSASSDFTLITAHKIPYNYGNLNPLAQEDWSGEAYLERAATQYQIGLSNAMSGRGLAAAFEAALADFDRGLANGLLPVEATPNAVFNRAVVAEAQAADPLASSLGVSEARYETVAAGYETYLQYVPKTPDARAVRDHVTRLFAWLSSDKIGPRPVAPPTFALKPLP